MKSRNIYLLALFFGAACGARGEDHMLHHTFVAPTNTFTLDWVIGEALSNNPSLKAAHANWQAMQERIPQENAWENARAGVGITAARFVTVPPNSFSDQSFSIEQPIPITGKNRLRARAATAEAAISAEELRRRELDLTARARASYFRLVNAYGQWEVNRKNAALLKQLADVSRNKFESGMESQGNVLSAETDLAKLEEGAFDFEREISEEQTVLNTLMNHPPNTPLGRPISAPFELVDLPFDKVEAAALAHRPELVAAQRKIDAAQARLKLAHRNWIPEPSLRVEANHYNGGAEPIDDVIAGVAFDLPWFNRGKYSAAVRENKNLLESAQYELQSLNADTSALIRDQLKKIETFHHHYELFRDKISPLAQQTIETSLTSYESSKAGLLEVLTAQRGAEDVESMLVQHLTDYQIALAELEAITGVTLAEISTQEKK